MGWNPEAPNTAPEPDAEILPTVASGRPSKGNQPAHSKRYSNSNALISIVAKDFKCCCFAGNNGKEPKKEEKEKQTPPVAKYQEKETNGIGKSDTAKARRFFLMLEIAGEEVVQQPKKKGFFKNFWKRSKHYSLEQQ